VLRAEPALAISFAQDDEMMKSQEMKERHLLEYPAAGEKNRH
jgi:hypothetical protein